jgi:hypothetical protein
VIVRKVIVRRKKVAAEAEWVAPASTMPPEMTQPYIPHHRPDITGLPEVNSVYRSAYGGPQGISQDKWQVGNQVTGFAPERYEPGGPHRSRKGDPLITGKIGFVPKKDQREAERVGGIYDRPAGAQTRYNPVGASQRTIAKEIAAAQQRGAGIFPWMQQDTTRGGRHPPPLTAQETQRLEQRALREAAAAAALAAAEKDRWEGSGRGTAAVGGPPHPSPHGGAPSDDLVAAALERAMARATGASKGGPGAAGASSILALAVQQGMEDAKAEAEEADRAAAAAGGAATAQQSYQQVQQQCERWACVVGGGCGAVCVGGGERGQMMACGLLACVQRVLRRFPQAHACHAEHIGTACSLHSGRHAHPHAHPCHSPILPRLQPPPHPTPPHPNFPAVGETSWAAQEERRRAEMQKAAEDAAMLEIATLLSRVVSGRDEEQVWVGACGAQGWVLEGREWGKASEMRTGVVLEAP